MVKSLVTGGSGFIGSRLVDVLYWIGHDVIVLDKRHPLPTARNPEATYFLQDLTEDCKNFSHHFEGVSNVFHLAAEVSIPFCIQNPRESMYNNVVSTANVLECARLNGVERFVFSSSSSVYGNTGTSPNLETDPVSCLNTYSASKFTGEQLCEIYYKLYGLKTVSLRYFNVYGKGHHKEGQYAPVMSIFMNQRDRGQELTVVGSGEQTRDFVHVSDVVNANILASTVDIDSYGEVFNVGTGIGTKIKDLADFISPFQTHLPERQGEVVNSVASVDKITEKLGWEPRTSVLEWVESCL